MPNGAVMERTSWRLDAGDDLVPGIQVERKLGGGERYEAFLGWDERLFAPVVAKVVRPHLVSDRATLEGLRREERLLRSLAHSVVVRCFGSELEGERPHLVLEQLDGPRLSSLLRRHGPLAMEQLLPLGLEICAALHYLGTQQVVHLDVKPSNIIMGAPPRLIDFSIARSVQEAAALRHVTGTDAYLAPEQADPDGREAPGPAADIWGLGATLYEALCGEQPFVSADRSGSARPLELPSQVPAVVATPVMSCLAPSAADRPTPAELAGELEPLVAALPRPVLGGLRARIS